MNLSELTGLVNNAALLLALCLVYDMIDAKERTRVSFVYSLMTGGLIGGIGIAIMLNPWAFTPGIQFDTRSVILSIAGLFLGPLPTMVAMLMTGGYRLYLGGPGVWAGVAVVATAGSIGLIWRYVRPKRFQTFSVRELYLLGLVVHFAMLLCMFSLPWPLAIHVLTHITVPVLLLFPATTAIIGWFMVKRDERKQAEHQLRDRESFLSSLLDAIPIPVFYKERSGRYLGCNAAFETFFGEKKERLIGKSVFDVNPEALARLYYAKDNELFERGGIQTYESTVKNRKGELRSVIFNKSVFTDYKGEGAGLIGAILDITERKEGEETLKWELALNEASAGISKELISRSYDMAKITALTLSYARNITRSREGFIVSIDRTTLAALGHGEPQMAGETCGVTDKREAFLPEPQGRYGALWGHAMDSRRSFFTNQPETHPAFRGVPEGHIPITNFLAVPVIISDKVWGMVALANSDHGFSEKDILAIERLREIYSLALYREEYERARAAMEKQLQQTQRLEAIGALAGGIAHDFNNILFPVIGFTEMMLDQAPEGSDLRESLNEVLTASIRASELVKQILAFSRQSESEKRALKMELIVREAVKLIRAGIPSTIAIDQRIDPDLNMVLADPTHIHQIAMNLMTNAFHAMEESGGVMTVRLERVEIALSDMDARHLDLVPGDYLCFSVSDTGLGMDKRVLDRIFEPYFTTKPEGKGTGLGLSVVHGIVKSLKGHIHVKSEPGEGSVFTVYLPVFNATEKRLPGF